MKYLKTITPSIASAFLFFVALSTFAWYSQYSHEKETFFASKIEELRVSYQVIDDSYLRTANIIYEDHINQPEILNLFKLAGSPDKNVRNQVRQKIYKILLPLYHRLEKRNIRQLHFHMPNGDSFLRFHKPSKFGDNLKDIRYSVMKANTELIPVRGFEEGRIKNGFRYVFPIFLEEKHLGSVEISLNFSAIEKQLRDLFHKEYSFILRKNIINEKVFKSEQSFYKESSVCDKFMVEKNTKFSLLQKNVSAALHSNIHHKLELGLSFVVSTNLSGVNYLSVFLPVKNVAGKHVAYIVSQYEDDTIAELFNRFLIIVIVTIMLMGIIGFSFRVISINNKKLALARKIAEQQSNSKSNFLANMSHEIRTPMNGILGMTRLVMGMELGGEQKKLLANVLYSAESLLGILNDILDFSKIEAGQLSFEQHNFSLEAMLDNVISSLSFQAIEKNIYLKNATDFSTVTKYVKADEMRIRQVLINLIGNAIKFTDKGGVILKVEVVKKLEKIVTLKFSVTDTGIGISPDKHNVIFETFTQTDTSTAREFGGTGLGLAISQRLVKMMNGKIKIDSLEGEGSIFHFTINVFEGKEVKENLDTESVGSRYKNLHILLVEDNKINQDLAKIVLEQDEQYVTVANNGFEALQFLSKDNFDIILMDMQMPTMDGISATKIIRACEMGNTDNPKITKEVEEKLIEKCRGKRIPIIAITANVLDRERQKCNEAGMDDFLTKPFLPEHLHSKLNKFSIHTSTSSASADKREKKKLENPNTNLFPKASIHLKNLYGIDDAAVERILEKARNAILKDLDALVTALQNEDVEKTKKIGHSFKGALLNLGFEKLAEHAKEIESIALLSDNINKNIVKEFIVQIETLLASN